MATIDIKIEGTLLIASVAGDLTAEEVIAVINDHYPSGIVKDVIWDLTHGTMQSMSMDGFKAVANASKDASSSGSRQGGKTVFVANKTAEYDMFCKYTALAEVAGVPVQFNVFKDIVSAKNWITDCCYSQTLVQTTKQNT
jgi:hypothetical protein